MRQPRPRHFCTGQSHCPLLQGWSLVGVPRHAASQVAKLRKWRWRGSAPWLRVCFTHTCTHSSIRKLVLKLFVLLIQGYDLRHLMTSYDYSGLKCISLREEGCFCKQGFVCINEEPGRKSAYWNETTWKRVPVDGCASVLLFWHWKSNLRWCKGASKQLAQQSKHLVLPPLYAHSHNIPCQIILSLQFDHARPLTICGKNDREPDWVLQVLRIPFLGDALVEQQRIFRCHSTQPHGLTLGGTILHFQHLQLSRGGSPSRWPKRRLSRSQRCLRESKKRKTLSWNHQALFAHFLPLKWFDLIQVNHWICWNCPMFLTSKRSNKQHVYNSLALNHPNPFTKLAMIPTPTTGEFHRPLTFARCPVASLLHAPAASSKLVKKNFTKLCFRSCFFKKIQAPPTMQVQPVVAKKHTVT